MLAPPFHHGEPVYVSTRCKKNQENRLRTRALFPFSCACKMKDSRRKAVAVKDDQSKDPDRIESCGHGGWASPEVAKNHGGAGMYRGACVYTRAYFDIPRGWIGGWPGRGWTGIYCISDRPAQTGLIDRPLLGPLKPATHARG